MIELNKFYISESVNFMKENMPNNFVDLTITSPPYDDLRSYNGYIFDYKSMFDELYRVTKDGGVVVWIVGDATIKGSETLSSFEQALYFKRLGFNVETMIYEKAGTGACGSNKLYWQAFEYMFILSKGPILTHNLIEDVPNKSYGKVKTNSARRKVNGEHKIEERKAGKKFSRRTNIWRIPVGVDTRRDTTLKEHPAIFPEQNEGDIVLDPFSGSGTTCKVAKQNNRHFIGIEISDKYCKLANERINNT